MKVLVACEFSGVVREAFRKRGHDEKEEGKEAEEGEALRQRNDDEGSLLQFHTLGTSAEVEALEAHLRLSRAIEEAKREREQKAEVGIPVCSMWGLVSSEEYERRSYNPGWRSKRLG